MGNSTDYLKKFNQYLTLKNYSPRTIKSYNSSILGFFSHVKQNVDSHSNSQEYATDFLLSRIRAGKSWSTINLDYSSFLILFGKVLQIRWDFELIPRPKMAKKLPVILSIQDIRKMINHVKNVKHQTIIILLYATGIRLSELLDLKLEDIDHDRLQIRINQGKGNRDRMVQYPVLLRKILKGYMIRYNPEEYLFNGVVKGTRYSPRSVQNIIKKACSKAGLAKNVSTHTLRHCFATHHLDFGTDIMYIKKQLGHSNLNVTAKYLHLCSHKRPSHIVHPIERIQVDYLMPLL